MNSSLPVHPLTLRFRDALLEDVFAADYVRTSLVQSRVAIFMGLLLYALFGLLDPWMVSEVLYDVYVVRAAVCAGLLGLLLVSLTSAFRRYMQAVLVAVSLVGVLGVTALVVVAQDADRYYDYYVGLVLVLFFVHVLLRMRFVHAAVIGWVAIGVYDVTAVALTSTPVPVLINSNFFLVAAHTSGMVASYLLERYAREVFWQTRLLEEKHRLLAAEDRRKTDELDEARRIQQAMLPQGMPVHPTVELAAYASPASEVGGDYYDLDLAEDGTLTFALGDATGHGAQASALVTAAKVLFTELAGASDLPAAMQRASGTLKRAGLGRRYVAFALGRLSGATLELVGAGLPPALLRRAETGRVEEIPLKGPPLGSFPEFTYRQVLVELAPGDTVVFMSDGLPELFNAEGEAFGYDRAAALMREAGTTRPARLLEYMAQAADSWRDDYPPSDDVTLLALRMKADVAQDMAGLAGRVPKRAAASRPHLRRTNRSHQPIPSSGPRGAHP